MKIHRSAKGEEVVAVCDRELMDTTLFRDGVEVHIRQTFYGDRVVSIDEVRAALGKAENANLMGERTIALAQEMGLIERSSCIMLGNVPHALVLRI
ncbi:MAG: DUF424 domain-containing protein [Methanolinea sp.]|nr:DUF424 domain-containing protein [Methanolinea sp.]